MATTFFLVFLTLLSLCSISTSLPTFSISHSSNKTTIICSLIQSSTTTLHQIKCKSFPQGFEISLNYTRSDATSLVGGDGFVCALIKYSTVMVCWRFASDGNISSYKRIYSGPALAGVSSGNLRICGIVADTGKVQCWQWRKFRTSYEFLSSVAVGEDFVCGLLEFGQIKCLGNYGSVVDSVPAGNYTIVAAGFRQACGISVTGSLECWGQVVGNKPQGLFKALALGNDRNCAIRVDGTVACWGENGFDLPVALQGTSFEAIEAKRGVFCGVRSSDLTLYCWGNAFLDSNPLVFEKAYLGPVPTGEDPSAVLKPESPQQSKHIGWSREKVAFLVVGCVMSLSATIALLLLCLRYNKATIGSHRVHDSGPLDDIESPQLASHQEGSQTRQVPLILEKRLSQMFSMGNGGNLEEFSFQTLVEATKNFSYEHKIGSGSFGSVYRATLQDGREVAIKRAELCNSPCHDGARGGVNGTTTKRQDDNEYAFVNELECLSCLNHKNLVQLLGFCEDSDEYALIYPYMENGSLHDHLHNPQSTNIMSWLARIQVALDAARGIKYLHVYADPPVIHRDIKSSNILLDTTWTAKVSDFGLSLMGPQENMSHHSLHAAGTFGYIDPEYFRLQQLTTKSDVYSFGVLLLELLSGKEAIHLNEERMPRNVVDYVIPYIMQENIRQVLDPKVPPPTPLEMEAITYIGYLAADCVTLNSQYRPTMSEIVNGIESALVACFATPELPQSASYSL